MPSFGIKEDDTAHSIIAEAFPNRKITSVPANVIVAGGGGIHCITQQQPAGN
jgi:agmatine deiminase